MSEDDGKNDPCIETKSNTLKLNNNADNNNIIKRRNSKKKSSKRKKRRESVNKHNNNIDNNDGLIIASNEIIEVKDKDKTKTKVDNFAEHNISIRNIIENALFSQLSEIKVFLLDYEEDLSQRLYGTKGKILPKIDYVELALLNQGTNISYFKKYGFGLYVFFLYLINLLVTFGVLLVFAFYYIYCIFYKYYQELEIECSLFFECNILSLASGVQIKKFRKYYIETFGKEVFLDKYKNFDVIYKEYIFTGTIVFIIAFLINFIYILYLQQVYKSYKNENPEINNYTLILSGKGLPCIKSENIKSQKEEIKNEIQQLLEVEDIDINFTLKLSEFYQKMDELKEKRNEKVELQHRIKKGRCLCCCCSKKKLIDEEHKLDDEIEEIKNNLNKIKEEKEYNPLYLVTFLKKEDYDRIYEKYPHSYLRQAIKNICAKNNSNIYVNKAPIPEDIAWENLEFDKEYRYFKNKFKNFGISCIYIVISFVLQLIFEWLGNLGESPLIQLVVNVGISYIQDKLNDKFSDFIHDKLSENLNSWSYSDIEFYSILYQSLFKFINQGIFPLLTYFIMDRILEGDDDFSNLVNKMFVIIEMDGFGYPMLDLFHNVLNKKGKDMYEAQEKMMSMENIDKEFEEQIDNKEGETRFELEQSFEKPEMKLGDNYSDVLNIYWITMFYLPIYPIGIIQSFLNLLFKFVIEKNFLINIYQRPYYVNPHFGFLCFNFFNFGFFLFLCGDIIFFRNEDNKKSFGAVYIVVMFLILLLPFYLLAKLIIKCCSKKEVSPNLEEVQQKIRSEYRVFNPCYQRQEIKNIFSEFKINQTLEDSQYEELEKKIDRLNDLDLFKLQQNLRIPKIFSFQTRYIESIYIYQNDSYEVIDQTKLRLYNLLMQFGFLPFLEEGNIIKPKRKRFEFINGTILRSLSLAGLSTQENLSNSDSGCFTIFDEQNELIMAYVDNERTIKIFDVFHKQVLNEVKDTHTEKILCVDYFKLLTPEGSISYLISLSLDNRMIIADLSINEKDKSIIVQDIGDNYKAYKDDEKATNMFSLSTCRHQEDIWLITSYYYDRAFKIYNKSGKFLYKVNNNEEFIISLQSLYLTDENTYICVRSTPNGVNQTINLFINEFFIRKIYEVNDSYINFKIFKPFDLIEEKKYITISRIQKNLTSYNLELIDISQILPLYTQIFNFILQYANPQVMGWLQKVKIVPATWNSKDAHTPMNQTLKNKIINNQPTFLYTLPFQLFYNEKSIESMREFYESNNDEKFNLGDLLFWEDEYIIVGTPFDYLDIIDFKNGIKVGTIKNSETISNINNGTIEKEDANDIVIYNISERLNDPEYGSTFIMRDNKGKIQYIRPSRIKDKFNYRFKTSDQYFNDLPDDEKLRHIYFSARFYFFYSIVSYVIPLITGFVGHRLDKPQSDSDSSQKDIYLVSFVFYIIYAFLGIWFKGCVYDIEDSTHTQRTCTRQTMYLCLFLKVVANSMLSFNFCLNNKRGIIFIVMLFIIYFIHLNFNFIVYCFKIKFLLRTYWLGFLFYQISRLCILVFFIVSFFLKVNHIETYIYAGILCVISAYMYMANYFNTLMRDITYNSYMQAIFNYPMEWMNLFCCWCRNPKDLIREIDYTYCFCDPYFLALAEALRTLIIALIYLFLYMIFCIYTCAGVLCSKSKNDD